ncbi:unnamed protein product [Didymodactylos carnosus]|uniref:Uncharacterized protein n=3 Tax=Didymodactylos carnosus TaxID=1234261 RepID=A0A8S2CZN8_9BILA|nr:unnamed protein product [Didymodactylos carnosus]CAF3587817.1 unnamed protein product [Didymodactylos carnosus]
MCDINDAIQIAVLGDKSVGKTAIIRQWLFNDFHIQYHETHMATYHFTALYNGDRLFHIRIIDTPRFEENDPDPQNEWVKLYCFRRCSLFLMVFDINREETFSYIKHLYREIVRVRNNLSRSSIEDDTLTTTVPIIIVANKADLINLDQRYSNVTLTNSREITKDSAG